MCCQISFFKKCVPCASKVAQQVKGIAAQLDELSSTPEAHMVEGDHFQKLSSDLLSHITE